MSYDEAVESLCPAHSLIYDALYRAAYLGLPCPSNKSLNTAAGRSNASARYASEAVTALERVGLIVVHRGYKARIVILPSGQSTEGRLEDLAPLNVRTRNEPLPPSVPIIGRSACPMCGTNSEFGCAHSRLAAMV